MIRGKVKRIGVVCGLLCAVVETEGREAVYFKSRTRAWVKLAGFIAQNVQSRL